MPKEGSKGYLPVLSTKKGKDKTENNQSVSKEGRNEDERRKHSGKKNKKSVKKKFPVGSMEIFSELPRSLQQKCVPKNCLWGKVRPASNCAECQM